MLIAPTVQLLLGGLKTNNLTFSILIAQVDIIPIIIIHLLCIPKHYKQSPRITPMNKRCTLWYVSLFVGGIIAFLGLSPALAQDQTNIELDYTNLVWMLTSGALIFFMNAGFAMLEAGLCQSKNATNVLAKNLIVFCASTLAFWFLGFGLMFGEGNQFWGQEGFFFHALNSPFNQSFSLDFKSLEAIYPNRSLAGVFFFQLVFAGTAATIVSGVVAERVKFWAFFWFSFCLVGISYPITGRWIWGPDGWLASNVNFLDFAGSTVVHSVGGLAGLVGAFLLGPRRGWQGYNPDAILDNKFTGTPQRLAPYNLTFSTLGCLVLWLGWIGFNGGSAKSIAHAPHIIITTMIAGAAGGVFVLLLQGLRRHKPSLPLVINGILGGLVSITASSAYVSFSIAMVIGAVGGLCVILGEAFLEFCQIDDPVGAVPVHLGCGIWGTLAVGLFVNQLPPYIEYDVARFEQIMSQVIGILSVGLVTLVLSCVFWLLIGLFLYGTELLNERLKQLKTNNQDNSFTKT